MQLSDNPLVSIVLPTFNGSHFLEQAIQSILNQSYPHWELIVVDDASTDNTPDLIEKYVAFDKRIRSIRHETNRKVPAALNTGFAQTKGVYLTWTSDDNCYRQDALAEMVYALCTFPKVDVVYATYSVIDEAGNVIDTVPVRRLECLAQENCIGPCFMYRRAVQLKLGGYAEDISLVDDYDFWLRAAASFCFAPLQQDLYLYRRHGDSLTSHHGQQVHWLAMKCLRSHMPSLHWVDDTTRAAAYLRIAMAEQMQDNQREVRESLFRAVRIHPPIAASSIAAGLLVYSLFGLKPFLWIQRFYQQAVPSAAKAPSLADVSSVSEQQ